MELAKSPRLWTAAAVAGGGLYALRWLASAQPPKRGAEERAELSREWYLNYLRATPHFDQLLRGLEITHMGADGTACGEITVEGALLSSEGPLHEGGLFDLIDTFGTLAVMAVGHPAGVSLEMGATCLAPVQAGERLAVSARCLRIGSTVDFTAVEVRRGGADGELVASATHTKHVGRPFLERASAALLARCLPLQRWYMRRGMRLLEAGVASLPKLQAQNMEEALWLQPLPHGHESGVHFYTTERLHLLNGYWAGHGASSAGLLAAAARQHLQGLGAGRVRFQDITILYMNPVPAFKPVGFLVTVLGGEGPTFVLVEMRGDKGKVYVRGRLTAVYS